ncbi:DNA helicase-2/ATP-dependent DNA helicase PcrA [Mycoplasmoides fastidiosum]|uniref:DNA 3'-5' helicase n=1 Tax=Mycoplasmoides fastidiosum TaxID=92758 RepID=A0ABU0LZJ4_9BACT|nr:UvrD-helicase domain-containing protein [Mycoplasmoides fastidiosum]MDQ0514130.1 DNA helicase-2/ATP-dependent DNA helicase PcrA [Mycoplasmoides fastidiosum]UUD37462.1 UvrD-helicase domain-containing protein [Mycoplasmoides fastidiosum]
MNRVVNQSQLEAIEAELKPTLVLSGAGTGKTFVLTQRIAFLINAMGINPEKIWAITFTKKASKEISERVQQECPNNTPRNISTFHGSCVWILRKHINLIGRSSNFSIIDAPAQRALITRFLKKIKIGYTDKKLKPSTYLNFILHFKGQGYTPEEVGPELFYQSIGEGDYKVYEVFKQLFRAYVNQLEHDNALDFDDILSLTREILQNPIALDYWQNNFEAILIDEFQDTEPLQLEIVNKIAAKSRNIFAVGDPDQSIYGWRGASPEIIDEFLDFYPDHQIIKLEQNYRSTQKILNVANTLIKNNPSRIDKNLFTERAASFPIFSYIADNPNDEANWVCDQIQKLETEVSDFQFSDVLVLYRNNAFNKEISEVLVQRGIQYIVHSGVDFYNREEIRTIISYLKLIIADDAAALRAVCNIPKRGISDTTLDLLEDYALENKISLYQAFFQAEQVPNLRKQAINGCVGFCELLTNIRQLDTSDIGKLIWNIFEISGYKASLDPHADRYRIDAIEQLINSIAEKLKDEPEKQLVDIIDELTLYLNIDEQSADQDRNKKINLMTIHASKGLEYRYVFVIKMDQGKFPSSRKGELEEERRLAYVGYTRAMDRLYLSCSSGYSWDTKTSAEPSIFLLEAEKCADVERLGNTFTKSRMSHDSFFETKITTNNKTSRTLSGIPEESLKVGALVEHVWFGSGQIREIGILNDKMKVAKIFFPSKNKTIDIVANSDKIGLLKN